MAGERAVTVTITKGRVSPPPSHVDVAVGTPVAITVSEDRDDVVHVHGYDEEVALHAGTPVVIRFVADQTGTFEVETHETGLTLFQLVVR
ncbi:hypothetical protein EV189_1904 [Motilibacter rhizosphaerae]|uniref:EfeO-type cupredoxin-like domain-containing protein n=1 Tax=Motilibacter rhizosphaerae TaxID=598652 RepID=A0A4Q7NSN6_9ACTN|nr:hypothetical protein EV189_1904 [Motilibacter rhizosphaerae]